mgnify:CR=1 FL=1|jgi:hypothetical protein
MAEEPENIAVGSGMIYTTDFTPGTAIPENTIIETEANRLGYIKNGATLTYTPTSETFKDDLGLIMRTKLTEEEVTFKFGLISWFYGKLDQLCSTCRVTDTPTGRTVKIGGVDNDDGKQHLFRFVHKDKAAGDVRITIVGTNTGGLALTYSPTDPNMPEPEITAAPSDGEGTLVLLDITDPGAGEVGGGV